MSNGFWLMAELKGVVGIAQWEMELDCVKMAKRGWGKRGKLLQRRPLGVMPNGGKHSDYQPSEKPPNIAHFLPPAVSAIATGVSHLHLLVKYYPNPARFWLAVD